MGDKGVYQEPPSGKATLPPHRAHVEQELTRLRTSGTVARARSLFESSPGGSPSDLVGSLTPEQRQRAQSLYLTPPTHFKEGVPGLSPVGNRVETPGSGRSPAAPSPLSRPPLASRLKAASEMPLPGLQQQVSETRSPLADRSRSYSAFSGLSANPATPGGTAMAASPAQQEHQASPQAVAPRAASASGGSPGNLAAQRLRLGQSRRQVAPLLLPASRSVGEIVPRTPLPPPPPLAACTPVVRLGSRMPMRPWGGCARQPPATRRRIPRGLGLWCSPGATPPWFSRASI